MGRDKTPAQPKDKKGKKGKCEPVAPRCVCERRCECGVRPERPSHGHKWDPESQKWVGRGAKESRVAAKLTDSGPREVKGVSIETWQKLPSQLLGEWCQREKRPKPRWHPARPKPGAAKVSGYRLRVVVPDRKKPGSEHDLGFVPVQHFPTEAGAKEQAALLALHHTQPELPLERKLPEPYRAAWLALTAAR